MWLAGCGAQRPVGPGDGGATDGAGDVPDVPFTGHVYAHTNDALYQVDPNTLAVSLVGYFVWPLGDDIMTDIAIDRNDAMVGISFDKAYAIDSTTAVCTYLAPLDHQFNGLSFVPAGEIDPTSTGSDILVAAALDGWFYRLDPVTGASTPVGLYGGVLFSSGDIVSVSRFGTVATVKMSEAGPDYLARIDPITGAATLIGPIGFTDVWGLGFWGNRVYGFVATREFILIDPTTGAGTLVTTGPAPWYGAAVTTEAPVIIN